MTWLSIESWEVSGFSSPTKVQRLNNHVFRVGSLGNPKVLSSYLIIDEKIALVDCGPRSVIEELLSLVKECGVVPSEVDALLLTHIHLDHAGGAGTFLERCSKAKVFIPERGYKHLLNPEALNSSARPILGERIFANWGACDPVPRERALSVKAHEKIRLGSIELEYLPAPGHAPHHNVLHDADRSVIFSADALGIYDQETQSIIPTTPPPSFDLNQASLDIRMIEELQPQLVCLAHFAEIYPERDFYDRVASIFSGWAEIVSSYVKQKNLLAYEFKSYLDVFSLLTERWPEYQELSEDLKEQVSRVDVGGLLNYFIRTKRYSS